MNTDWVIWQLCDSAFPAGAFAHSAGLEAAWQQGEVVGPEGLAEWILAALRQTAAAQVPVLLAAHDDPARLGELDALCESFLLNHVANRASRAQGQALLMACVRTFELDEIRRAAEAVRAGTFLGHYASAFGFVARALAIPRRRTAELFLFLALRGAISSAVRLGIIGPLQGQNVQHRLGAAAAEWVDRSMDMTADKIVQTSPVADILHGAHDRLYSRLFVT